MNTDDILRRFENQIESLNETQDLTDYAHKMLGGLLVEIRNNLGKESDSLPNVSVCPDCGSGRTKKEDYHFPEGLRCEACYHVWQSEMEAKH